MFQIKQCLTTFILIISVVQWIKAEKSCNKGNLEECLAKIQDYFEDDYHFAKKTESEIDEFCQKLQEDSECLNIATEVCKKTYPLISALTVTLYNQVNQLCSPGTHHKETYMKMLPCIDKHSEDFKECSGKHLEKKFDDEKLQSVCMDMHSMICVADKSRKYCDEVGNTLAKRLEFGVKDQYEEVCSGSTRLFDHFWVLTPAVLVALLLRNKMKL
ncbi:uncharacterized protein LOC129957473 [Argiope bruennichi]|uniref:uncharacterized protein LOC129957473 n=1 Tax=Argiope bruennichi TaxID=94029 RepID=UPI002494E370|nr:uncharacterized protein LOC129957473 [Argiope bruennichi]